MGCRIVCISRSLGAGGEEVAHLVAKSLKFRLVDDEILARAAEKAGVTPETIEKVERSASLIDRILKYMGTAQGDPGFGAYIPPVVPASESYEGLITSVIRETAATGNVVILARMVRAFRSPGRKGCSACSSQVRAKRGRQGWPPMVWMRRRRGSRSMNRMGSAGIISSGSTTSATRALRTTTW